MRFSPKLKMAMEKIKRVLEENDIAGFVVLEDKTGHTEFLNHLVPSYSLLEVGPGTVRVAHDLKDKFEGDHDKFMEAVQATSDMLYYISDTAIKELGPIAEASHMMDTHFGTKHGQPRTTSNDETFN